MLISLDLLSNGSPVRAVAVLLCPRPFLGLVKYPTLLDSKAIAPSLSNAKRLALTFSRTGKSRFDSIPPRDWSGMALMAKAGATALGTIGAWS
jgi:hypothetical protein